MLEAKERILVYQDEEAPELKALDVQLTVTKEVWNTIKSGIYPPVFHQYSKKGLYVFRLHERFKEKFVIVDRKDEGSLALLIYKAYNKLRGGEIKGSYEEQMTDLTGVQRIVRDVTDNEEERKMQWHHLRRAKNAVVACSLDANGERMYPVMEAFMANSSKGSGKMRFVQLYGTNPNLELVKEYSKNNQLFCIHLKTWKENFRKLYIWRVPFRNFPHHFAMWEYDQAVGEDADKFVMVKLEETRSEMVVSFTQEMPAEQFTTSLHSIGLSAYKDEMGDTPFETYKPERKWQITTHLKLRGPAEFAIQLVVENQQRDGHFWVSVSHTVEEGSNSTISFNCPKAEKLQATGDQSDKHEVLEESVQEFVLKRRQCFFKIN